MKKPVLVVMAAGMGSRYGGLKQMDPVGPGGRVIMDYSLFDAQKAGFEQVIFVIKEENEAAFRETVLSRLPQGLAARLAYQRLEDLPLGYSLPAGRQKPWGTAHAVLAVRGLVQGPFAVINADDYYGPQAFGQLYRCLCDHPDGVQYEYAMVGYRLCNTLTENGYVSRGVCEVSQGGFLQRVTEYTRLYQDGQDARYPLPGGGFGQLSGQAVVSMNLWGFHESFLKEAWARFPAFLDKALAEDPQRAEYYLPTVVSALLAEGKARVRVLTSPDRWHGVTYQQDKPAVMAALRALHEAGIYPL